jgi:MFS family permease
LEQYTEAADLLGLLSQQPCLRQIVLVVWAVTFGGNMQSPVIPFFYLEIEMTAVEIGNTGFIIFSSLLLSSPAYGLVFDRWGAYPAVLLSLSACGVGCLARALCSSANEVYVAAVLLGLGSSFETISLATLARSLPHSSRSLVVSGFLLQIKRENAFHSNTQCRNILH